MSQIPSSLGSSSFQDLPAASSSQSSQEAEVSFAFESGWLICVTPRLEASLNKVQEGTQN